MFDLRERGHAIYLLADAVGSRAETDHRLALHEMREVAGARITTVETVALGIARPRGRRDIQKVAGVVEITL